MKIKVTKKKLDKEINLKIDHAIRKFLKDCDLSSIDCIKHVSQSVNILFDLLSQNCNGKIGEIIDDLDSYRRKTLDISMALQNYISICILDKNELVDDDNE